MGMESGKSTATREKINKKASQAQRSKEQQTNAPRVFLHPLLLFLLSHPLQKCIGKI
jgi:hypothetical protein